MSELPVGPRPPLTAAMLQDLIAQAEPLAREAHRLLAPVASRRAPLRQRLLQAGEIEPFLSRSAAVLPSASIAAVDGGSVREHLYAADLMVAVAASAEGMTSAAHLPLGQRHWAAVRTHESDNDRLLAAAMAGLELCLIASLQHDLRLLDGSHGTPVIALSTALSARSPAVAQAAADLVTDEVVDALAALADPDRRTAPGEVVALPKADSSTAFSERYLRAHGLDLPGGDRFVAAQVLGPGEMLRPRPADELADVHVSARDDATPHVRAVADRLDEAVAPLRRAAAADEVVVTYLRPTTAETILKVEARVSEPLADARDGDDGGALAEVRRIAALLSAETPGPHLQEPFAQYAVDLAAKAVSTGAEALNEALLANLPDGSEDYLMWLARSYRTRVTPSPARTSARPPANRPEAPPG
ncbi:hypothetical protein [Quadrisphaera sp. DSM 44207]|uniref:hypothetical protein n=1 Tax=Quadrisphaera sp. DSM 44207 TaxID=1881057 RepID=UPI000882CDDE|nr:hypothetical protein [Quadrisphaera sp. DSM 44207]SDQ04369.1 hypothetical protein SAMN05428996_0120 [Quadrisphaera sp. DSM 44207]